jgi:hypothetical protein
MGRQIRWVFGDSIQVLSLARDDGVLRPLPQGTVFMLSTYHTSILVMKHDFHIFMLLH